MASLALTLALAGAAVAPLVEGEQLATPPWHVVTLPRQSKPVTRFTAERVDERPAVRIDADKSYGNLVHDIAPGSPVPQRLRWSWRLQQPNPQADLRQRAGDDTAAKVCLSFDLPLDQVPFGERQFLRFARASTSQPLPAETLCWVWAGHETPGAVIDSPFTRRVRYIVLRTARDPLGAWVDESRDIAADFRRAFGDEAAQMPPLVAVLIGGDSDNTGLHTVAHVGALRFEP